MNPFLKNTFVFIVFARKSKSAGCINDFASASRVSSPGYLPNASHNHSGKLLRTNGFNAAGSTTIQPNGLALILIVVVKMAGVCMGF
jgi:hypothetical protein